MSNLLHTGMSISGMAFPHNKLIWTLSGLKATLFNAGKQNDIANNNSPLERREWDLKYLKNSLFGIQDSSMAWPFTYFNHLLVTFNNVGRFIKQDLKNAFTITPWKMFQAQYNQKDNWVKPQPYLSALSTQLSLCTWLFNMAGILLKKPVFFKTGIPLAMLADSFWYISITNRAWENKTDMDGLLVLAGSPLALAGFPFQPTITQKYFFLHGLEMMGSALVCRGVALNSKKYGYFVNTLKSLAAQAQCNPALSATDILAQLKTHPDETAMLEQKMGKSRFHIFMNTLYQAHRAHLETKQSLSDFLAPIAASSNHKENA